MTEPQTTVVSIAVVPTNPEHVVRTGEAFNRAAAGLALDGIAVNVNYGIPEDEPDDDSEDRS